jgi:hypothetical protein
MSAIPFPETGGVNRDSGPKFPREICDSVERVGSNSLPYMEAWGDKVRVIKIKMLNTSTQFQIPVSTRPQ